MIDTFINKWRKHFRGEDCVEDAGEFKVFRQEYLKLLQSLLPDEYFITPDSQSYCVVSAFIRYQGRYIYITTRDLNSSPLAWYEDILILQAKEKGDYSGTDDTYTTLADFASSVESAFRQEKKKNGIFSFLHYFNS